MNVPQRRSLPPDSAVTSYNEGADTVLFVLQLGSVKHQVWRIQERIYETGLADFAAHYGVVQYGNERVAKQKYRSARNYCI